MIKWKQCMFGAVLAGAVCMNMPQAAFAYDVPEMIEVGLESVCKNATSASIGSSQLAVGTLKNDKFREDGTISSSGGFTHPAAIWATTTGQYMYRIVLAPR